MPPEMRPAWVPGLISLLIGIALLIGLLTPIASISAALGFLAGGFFDCPWLPSVALTRQACILTALNLSAISICLVLLGPGAFSFDARLFGRREIIIPKSRNSPFR